MQRALKFAQIEMVLALLPTHVSVMPVLLVTNASIEHVLAFPILILLFATITMVHVLALIIADVMMAMLEEIAQFQCATLILPTVAKFATLTMVHVQQKTIASAILDLLVQAVKYQFAKEFWEQTPPFVPVMVHALTDFASAMLDLPEVPAPFPFATAERLLMRLFALVEEDAYRQIRACVTMGTNSEIAL